MTEIKLPAKNNQDSTRQSDANTGEPDATGINVVQEQLSNLADQIGAINKTRKDDEAAKKKKEEDDAQAELEANADLRELLSGGVEDEEITKEDRLDKLTNAQLVDVIAEAVQTSTDAMIRKATQGIDEKLKATNDSIGKVASFLGQMQAAAGMQSARARYPDFDDFREETLAVLKVYPMMGIEDAYLLAKQKKTGASASPRETESERPMRTPFGEFPQGRGEAESTRTEKASEGSSSKETRGGVVDFRKLVNASLDKRLGI